MVLSHLGVRDNSKNSSNPLTVNAHLQVVKLLHPVFMLKGLHFERIKNFKGVNYRQTQELALLTGKSGRCKIQPTCLETSHLLWSLKWPDSQVHANHWNQTRGHHITQGLPHTGNGVVTQSEAQFTGSSKICNHLFPYGVHMFEKFKVFTGHNLQTGNGGPW